MIETARVQGESSFLFFAFLIGFAFVVLLEYLYPEFFRRDTRRLFYFSTDASLQRNNRAYAVYRALSSLLFGFAFALFLSFCLGEMYFCGGFSWLRWGATFGFALVFLGGRYLIDRFLAWLFGVNALEQVLEEKRTAFQLSFAVYGLILFFLGVYSGFFPDGFEKKALLGGFILYFVGYVAVMVEYLARRAEYFFYFIFYLCVVEICPVLVAWSMLKRTLAG